VLEPCFKGKREELTLPYDDWIITCLFVLTPWAKEVESVQAQRRFAARLGSFNRNLYPFGGRSPLFWVRSHDLRIFYSQALFFTTNVIDSRSLLGAALLVSTPITAHIILQD
jgi:hypothetical protein